MKTNHFGYIVGIEDERIYIGKITDRNRRRMTPEGETIIPHYRYVSEYLRRKGFDMTPRLSMEVYEHFSIGQYVMVTAEKKQVKSVSLLTDLVLIDDILKTIHHSKKRRIDYADIRQQEQIFLNLTGLTTNDFDQLVPAFEEAFQERMRDWCLSGKKRIGRKYQTQINCPLPIPEERLLYILAYLRSNPLQVLQEELSDESYIKVNPWIHTLLIVLQTTLEPLIDTPYHSLKELVQQLGSLS